MTERVGPHFTLPGTWGRVNLATEATMQSSIRKVVEHGLGRNDNLASLRAEMRKKLRESADIARKSDAIDFYISFEIVPGVPLPAWLAVFLPEAAPERFESLDLDEMAAAIGVTATAAPGAQPVTSTRPANEKIRAVRQVSHRINEGVDGEPSTEVLQVDYWLVADHPNRIALMSFTTQLVELEEQMLALFDAVLSTVRWPAPLGVDGAQALSSS